MSKSPARETWREKATDVAYQRQLRDRFVGEWSPPVTLELGQSVVRPLSRKAAEQVILRYEWLGTMSATSRHFGLFFGGYCAGVTCVGGANCTAGPWTYKMFGIERSELLILARGACVHWAPPGANSRLVSWTCKLLARERAGKVLVAYADSDAGEIGTIYQACNWTYIGPSTTSYWELVAPSGRVLNQQNVTAWARRARLTYTEAMAQLAEQGWTKQKPNAKHRYVYPLDKKDGALAERLDAMRLPYPKRGRSIDSDASGDQPE
jgi:hypothetical protein